MKVIHWFNQNIDEFELVKRLNSVPEINISLYETVKLLNDFSLNEFQELLNENDFLYDLSFETGVSIEKIKDDFRLMTQLLSGKQLLKRVKIELGSQDIFDKFIRYPQSEVQVRAYPKGKTLHVTAGNVYFSFLDSLIMGLLTKNPSVIKLSYSNQVFVQGFLSKLKKISGSDRLLSQFALVSWRGGDKEIETVFKQNVDQILAWGGEEMLKSYEDTPRRVNLLTFGPKVSFQVLTKNVYLEKSSKFWAQKIVEDILPWNQQACSSPQNLFVESGIDVEDLMHEISLVFEKSSPRNFVSNDEFVEIHKEYYRGLFHESQGQGLVKKGDEYLLHFSPDKSLTLSPLNRSLLIKKFTSLDELSNTLKPHARYLQSCAYGATQAEKQKLLHVLSLSGVKRFSPMGTITFGREGAPHDGVFILREMVQFISHDLRIDYLESACEKENRGYVFSSGGTTGEPKTTQYSFDEFDLVSQKMSENFKHRGVAPGDTVANLFVAGNMWSSFLAVDRALEKCDVLILPIGGFADFYTIISNLIKFKPRHIMGIPSLLIKLAEEMEKHKINFSVDQIFYAGERLTDARETYLKKIWSVQNFSSCGYATVEAGIIGYQCPHCSKDEHHVFSDLIDLKIQNDQGVVTSKMRSSELINEFYVGDKMQWCENHEGISDPVFQLMGRSDDQIQIWSARFYLSEIEKILEEFEMRTFKIELREIRQMNLPVEIIHLMVEHYQAVDEDELKTRLYESLGDVRLSVDFDFWLNHFQLSKLNIGELPRNQRTGKISLIQDLR